ncbi:MAG TPA: hypothetical protein VF403_00170 [Kofleriaceae bacterium]
MRFAVVLVLGACVGGSSATPKWPKQHLSEVDGGESLAPHVAAAQAIAAVTEDVKPAATAVVTPATVPTTTPVVTTPAVTAPTDETIQTEEIIIEIDD